MKLKLLIILALPFILGTSFTAAKQGKLNISYTTVGTIEGYSYISKMEVFIDGQLVATGPEKDQQEKNSFSISVPRGEHKIKCQLWALYQGTWELRTLDNNYSFDWIYEGTREFKKKNSLEIVFSIDDNTVTAK